MEDDHEKVRQHFWIGSVPERARSHSSRVLAAPVNVNVASPLPVTGTVN